MKNKHKNETLEKCTDSKSISKETIEKVGDDYCLINNHKIEGNACSTILDNK